MSVLHVCGPLPLDNFHLNSTQATRHRYHRPIYLEQLRSLCEARNENKKKHIDVVIKYNWIASTQTTLCSRFSTHVNSKISRTCCRKYSRQFIFWASAEFRSTRNSSIWLPALLAQNLLRTHFEWKKREEEEGIVVSKSAWFSEINIERGRNKYNIYNSDVCWTRAYHPFGSHFQWFVFKTINPFRSYSIDSPILFISTDSQLCK